eukprot:Pgem_evm1s2223
MFNEIGIAGEYALSAGERRRLGIAIELLTVPSVLALDEPTSGLDATAALSVMELLKELTKDDILIISIVHQPRKEIFDLFDRLILMSF